MKRFYLAEGRALFRGRTRIPVLDTLVRAGALEVLDMMAGGLYPATERDVQDLLALLAKRQRFYGGLALLGGRDVRPFPTRNYGIRGLSVAAAGLLDLRDSLTAPPDGVAQARNILTEALDRELHDADVVGDAEDAGRGG
ncbi:hypothetical protein DL769_001649 [Monosporascus sp. CRB-8-3]|nr:hypothetical protein DL769_001649 [Monosporascus sp. CRB-8-3]